MKIYLAKVKCHLSPEDFIPQENRSLGPGHTLPIVGQGPFLSAEHTKQAPRQTLYWQGTTLLVLPREGPDPVSSAQRRPVR